MESATVGCFAARIPAMASSLPIPQVRRLRLPPGSIRGQLGRLAFGLPILSMVGAILLLTVYCRSLLLEAAAGKPVAIGGVPLALVAGGFLFASASVVLLQSMRVAARVAGPELRLVRAMQRIREGDISFRVNLRRGDLLTDLARECNDLLDWLNANPPRGARTGGDIVEVEEPVTSEVGP